MRWPVTARPARRTPKRVATVRNDGVLATSSTPPIRSPTSWPRRAVPILIGCAFPAPRSPEFAPAYRRPGDSALTAPTGTALSDDRIIGHARRFVGSPGKGLTGLTGKQIVDESRWGGLWFVVGQARPLVDFDEGVLLARDVGHEQVDAGHWDADRFGGRNGDPAQPGVHVGGDTVDRAPLMQVGSVANPQPIALGQNIIQLPAAFEDRRLGDSVQRNFRLATSGRRAPS